MSKQLIVFSGIPCSGKSSARDKFTDQWKKENVGYTVICRDDIRDRFWVHPYRFSRENENRVTNIANLKFGAAVSLNWNIIIDNTHCKEAYLDEWVKRTPEGYELKIVFFPINFYLACLRNIGRYLTTRKWIPWDVMSNMKKNFDNINKEKYAKYVVHV